MRLFLIGLDNWGAPFEAAGERFGGISLLAICLIVLRRGHLVVANLLLLVGTLLSTALVALNLGNLAGDPYAILISLIVVASLTAGSRGVLLTGAGAIIISGIMTWLFVSGSATSSNMVMEPSVTSGISFAIVFATLTYMLYLAARTLDRLLDKLTRVNASLVQEVAQRNRASEALRQSQADLSLTLDNAPIGIFTFDLNGYLLRVNHALCAMLGYSTETLLAQHMQDLISENDRYSFADSVQKLIDGEQKHVRLEQEFITNVGDSRNVILHLGLTFDSQGAPKHIIASVEDVTESLQMRAKLNAAQKQESIGILAGGIAHDFNNLLTAMLGQGSLALQKMSMGRSAEKNVEKVIAAAEKAGLLTKQLLAYAGKGQVEMRPLCINTLIEENRALLTIALSKNVQLTTDLSSRDTSINGDLAQMQQVIMNLMINAGDAMPSHGGVIHIHTEHVYLTEQECVAWQVTPSDVLQAGNYLLLEVSDDGNGMDQNTLSRIFDPFFTTKDTGHGLGLAAVMGIVRTHGGGIIVDSVVGEGTTFQLIFPLSNKDLFDLTKEGQNMMNTTQHGLILVIDDEPAVCEVVTEVLELAGIDSIVAGNGQEGIDIFKESYDKIDLVLLDLTMPGLSGEETFMQLREIDPEMRVIVSSGHSRHQTSATFGGIDGVDFLPKPYDFVALQSTVQDNLTVKPEATTA